MRNMGIALLMLSCSFRVRLVSYKKEKTRSRNMRGNRMINGGKLLIRCSKMSSSIPKALRVNWVTLSTPHQKVIMIFRGTLKRGKFDSILRL